MKNMKKTKWAVVCAALMAMVGFTSCLEGENSTISQASDLVKVSGMPGFYTFTSSGGYTINPTNLSSLGNFTLSNPYAIIYYSFDRSTLVEGFKNVDAQILQIVEVKSGPAYPFEAPEEGGNEPVYQVSNNANIAQPIYYDRYNLFLPVCYYCNYSSSMEDSELAEELASHSFTLYYDEEGSSTGEMRLQLCHDVTDSSVKRNYLNNNEYRHFDITSIIGNFESDFGELPNQIRVEFKQALSAEASSTTTGTITFDYGRYFEDSSNR